MTEKKVKDMTVDTTGYENKDANCKKAIEGRMAERNPASKKKKKEKVVQNGVTMPTRKSDALRVWQISSYCAGIEQAPPNRETVIQCCVDEGIREATAKRNHSQWRKFYGADEVVVQAAPVEEAPVFEETTGDGEAAPAPTFAPQTGESFTVSKDAETGEVTSAPLQPEPDTSFNVEELEAETPAPSFAAAPAPVIPEENLRAWQKSPATEEYVEQVPDVEAPPNGWGIQPSKEVVPEHPIVTEAPHTLRTRGVVVPDEPNLPVEQIAHEAAFKTAVNHALATGAIQVYTTQNLSDVAIVILDLVKNNPEAVREFLDANS